jgi:SAM-dependent methyltransferase
MKNSKISKFYRKLIEKRSFLNELKELLVESKSILDVGCGANSPFGLLNLDIDSTGIDIHKPSILKSKAKNFHNNYIECNLIELDKYVEPKSFDTVISLDVIEHFEKKDGLLFLEKMEKVAIKKLIIFTPNGFLKQVPKDNNPFQEHKSGWKVDELKKLGFIVIGINGWKPFRGELAKIRFKPKYFWLILSDFSQKFVRNRPKHAFQLLAIKYLK